MARLAKPKEIIIFVNEDGKEPFFEWLNGIKDAKNRQRILSRIRRLEQGNYGDCESVGNNVCELRLFFGSGYRVYFGETTECIVVLLCGGDKKTQKKDIKQATIYWQEYLNDEKTQNI